MDHHAVFSVALIAVGVVVAVAAFAHHQASSAIYAQLLTSHSDGSKGLATPTPAFDADASAYLVKLAREGAEWSRRGFWESHFWALAILVGIFFFAAVVKMFGK